MSFQSVTNNSYSAFHFFHCSPTENPRQSNWWVTWWMRRLRASPFLCLYSYCSSCPLFFPPFQLFQFTVPPRHSSSIKAASLSNHISNHVLRASPWLSDVVQAPRGCLFSNSPPPQFWTPLEPSHLRLPCHPGELHSCLKLETPGPQGLELCLWIRANGAERGWFIWDENSRDTAFLYIILKKMVHSFRKQDQEWYQKAGRLDPKN